MYGLGTFQTSAFELGPRVSKSVHFKSSFSIPYSSIVFLDVIPIGFQSQAFRGLISSTQNLGVGVPDVEHKALTSQGKVSYFTIPPNCGSLPLDGFGFVFWIFFFSFW